MGKTHVSTHVIDTGTAAPIQSGHYPLSPVRQEEVYRELDRMLGLGVIEESNSPTFLNTGYTLYIGNRLERCLLENSA